MTISAESRPDLAARLNPYLATGAVWVPGRSLFVNRDFDFNLALSDDVAGAGLAALRRRRANEALAQRLAVLPSASTVSWVRILCGVADACASLPNRPIRVYGLLFGSDTVRLQVVLEIEGDSTTYSVIGESRSLEGLLVSDRLDAAFATGLGLLSEVLHARYSPSRRVIAGRCIAGGVADLEGVRIASFAGRALLRVRAAAGTLHLSCPEDAFRASGTDNPAERPGDGPFH